MMSFSVLLVAAQKIDEVKNLVVFNKFKEAKTEVDKGMNNPKFNTKAEAYMLKTVIYAGLSMEEANKNSAAGDQLANDADLAFKKYKEMDPSMSLINDPIYQNGPINLYSNYYTSGFNDYSGKKWQASYEKFKRAVEYSDLLIKNKLFQSPLDTNVLILAGITAENSNNKEEAVLYYSRLADNKVTGEGFESVYRYLVSHYFAKKDMASFEKYKALGRQLYPKSEYFEYDKVDFAVGLVEKFEEKVKAVEEVLVTDPDDFKANEVLGEVIFEALNPKEDTDPVPANADELEKRMVLAFNKAASVKPDYEIPYLFIGDHFINKAVKMNNKREAHQKEMQARTKPGTKSSPEDIKKRDDLDKVYGETLEEARIPYEKSCEIFANRAKASNSLEMKDKQQYKKAASYLADISAFKKVQAKGNAANQAKFATEEAKWNSVYESISAIADKKK
jgi:hypothetical protein